jgi:hypothetical protein
MFEVVSVERDLVHIMAISDSQFSSHHTGLYRRAVLLGLSFAIAKTEKRGARQDVAYSLVSLEL